VRIPLAPRNAGPNTVPPSGENQTEKSRANPGRPSGAAKGYGPIRQILSTSERAPVMAANPPAISTSGKQPTKNNCLGRVRVVCQRTQRCLAPFALFCLLMARCHNIRGRKITGFLRPSMVLLDRIELSTSPLPRASSSVKPAENGHPALGQCLRNHVTFYGFLVHWHRER
jgi:hypothetical protein